MENKNKKLIRRELFHFVKKKKFLYLLLCFTMIIGILLDLALPWFMMNVTNIAVLEDGDRFSFFIWVGVLILFANFFFHYFDVFLKNKVASFVRNDMRKKLFAHSLLLPLTYHDKNHSGSIVSKLTNDVNAIGDLMGSVFFSIIRGPLVAIVAFIYLLTIHWPLALICGLIGPLTLCVGAVFGKAMKKNSILLQERMAKAVELVQDVLAGIPIIRSYSLEKSMNEKYVISSDRIYEHDLKNGKISAGLHATSSFIGILSFLLAFGLGSYFVMEESISIGELIAFIQLLNHIVWPFTGLAGLWGQMQSSLAGAERVFETMHEQPWVDKFPSILPMNQTSIKSIEFQNVSFAYQDKLVIKELNLKIRGQGVVALVGPNGAGKSTLFKLLQNFYSYSGDILINNRNIAAMTPEELLSYFSVVPQESCLFSGTILENINPNNHLSRDDVDQIIELSHAKDLIEALPGGLNFHIGEKGSKLSGGQKQRIAIARALAKDAPILLLDEATSALDNQSESSVNKAITNLMKDKTTFVIAHRLSTVTDADLIVVLDDGEIVELGDHDQLLSEKGLYHRLYHAQFKHEDELVIL